MDKEQQLRQALNHLSNNWRADPKLREAFNEIFHLLNSGSEEDKANAQILLQYLDYPGSESAQGAASLLHASLQIGPARSAAGLPQKRRGPVKSPEEVKLEDRLMQVLIRHELGKAKDFDVEAAVIDHLGIDAVKATQKVFLEKLKPRAKAWAEFFRHMQSSYTDDQPL
jgi:hypothetical protein